MPIHYLPGDVSLGVGEMTPNLQIHGPVLLAIFEARDFKAG